jgi:uncharacterized damage-inducible protein DinB
MSDDSIALATVYAGWAAYQQQLITVVQPLTAAQLALRAAPTLRSIHTLATHIIGARARWTTEVLDRGGPDLAALAGWDRPGAPPRTAAELAAGLDLSGQVLQTALREWTVADLAHVYTGARGGEAYALRRQWVLWHLIDHDLHHGGELSFTLGQHDLTALDL